MKTKATIALFGMALPLVAGAQESVSQRQEGVEKTLESVLSKAGLSISGRATGEFAQSTLSGSTKRDTARAAEPLTYTQVDFELRARPNAVTTVKADFRMHLDWPNFFGAPYTPFETRWLSIDGKAMDNILYYSVGDMSVKWSPYTVYGNDVGFLYTPRMFAQMQQQAMAERFLGNNVRNLQGVQAGIRAAAPEVAIDSFNVGFLASKLASAANSGDNPPAYLPYVLDEFDRWVLGGRADVTFLKGLSLGTSYLDFRDLKGTYELQDTNLTTRVSRNTAETGRVIGGRFGVQVDRLVELPLQVGLNGEVSLSHWEYQGDTLDILTGETAPDTSITRKKIDGIGLSTDLVLGYSLEKIVAGTLTGGFVMNDSGYRNDLAQAQSFSPARIFNTVQDDSYSHYSTFDALYHNVHRFVPETQSNTMAKNPVEKIAYTNQIGSGASKLDPVLQTVLPGGSATANRVGPRFGLDVGFLDGAITVVGNGWILATAKNVPLAQRFKVDDSLTGKTLKAFDSTTEFEPKFYAQGADTATLDLPKVYKVNYQKVQAGLKVRAEKFLGDAWTLPIELTGSYEMNGAKSGSVLDFKANILNAGVYVGVWKRISLVGGYQLINTEDVIQAKTNATASVWSSAKYTSKQSNVGGGLEYKITEGSYATFLWNRIKVEYPEDKFLKDPKASAAVARDFTQDILNAKLTVGF